MDPQEMIDLIAAKLYEQTQTHPSPRFADLTVEDQGVYRQHVTLTMDALYAAGFIVGKREAA